MSKQYREAFIERFGDPETIERERPTHRPTDARPTSHAELVKRQDALREIPFRQR
jgi:hypothetical protein